jgi:hypothetical protein
MARAGRLAGAILAETEGHYFLVGNTKEPCDYGRAGFEPPAEVDALARPFVRLAVSGPPVLPPPWLLLPVEGQALPRFLAERFLIERNGSVSDRLWRLVTNPDGDGAAAPSAAQAIDACWLAELPAPVWRIVREAVLKCM